MNSFDIEETINKLRNILPDLYSCRKIHEEWADYLQDYPDFDTSSIGSRDHHLESVEMYNKRIDAVDSAIGVLKYIWSYYDL